MALSLADIYNKFKDLEETLGSKINYLYNLYESRSKFPITIDVTEDSPGLWPDHGVITYSIIPQMNVSENFCTEGVLIHYAANKYAYQTMTVTNDVIDSNKIGRIYVRYSASNNEWSEWQELCSSTSTFQSLAYKGYMRRKSQIVIPDANEIKNYIEIALSIGAYYSTDLKRELNRNYGSISYILQDLNDKVVEFDNNLLNIAEGDVLIYGRNEYIAIYDGAGGCFGSSLEVGSVEHFDNCLMNEFDIKYVIKV
jgi:hypothetical protein